MSEDCKWNLNDLYRGDGEWLEDALAAEGEVRDFAELGGKVSNSAAVVADILEAHSRVARRLQRVSVYAQLRACEDLRRLDGIKMRDRVGRLLSDFEEAGGFLEPWLVTFEYDQLLEFEASEPRLVVYGTYLEDLFRRKTHVLSEREERIIAAVRPMVRAMATAFRSFAEVELKCKTIRVSDGRSVQIDHAAYIALRHSEGQQDRRRVTDAFFETLGDHKHTFAAMMRTSVERLRFEAKCRGYSSSAEMRFDVLGVPPQVPRQILGEVRRNLPTFHRYLASLRAILGLDRLYYADLWAPIRGDTGRYSLEDARRLVLDAMKTLGPKYSSHLSEALHKRWIDYLPSVGKHAGAFATGGPYDCHPYAMLNFRGTYSDVSALAHESGHLLHAVYRNNSQQFPLSASHPWIGEVIAVLHEVLLLKHMVSLSDSGIAARRAFWGHFLERVRTTMFRQALFAEFELSIHEMARQGEPLTGPGLSEMYLNLVRSFHGHDDGVCVVEESVAYEWTWIEHLRGGFSVISYVVAFGVAGILAANILKDSSEGTQRVLDLIAAGSSKPMMELLIEAGVNLNAPLLLEPVIDQMKLAIEQS